MIKFNKGENPFNDLKTLFINATEEYIVAANDVQKAIDKLSEQGLVGSKEKRMLENSMEHFKTSMAELRRGLQLFTSDRRNLKDDLERLRFFKELPDPSLARNFQDQFSEYWLTRAIEAEERRNS